MNNIDLTYIDPRYVQITRKQAAMILGISPADFDRRRKSDKRCPAGFKENSDRFSRVKFRLSDIYKYSEAIIQDSTPVDENKKP